MLRSPFPNVEIPDVPLTDFVLARAGECGDKPALIDAPTGRTITYAQLVEFVRAVAAGLAERGFGKGDVFAHYAPNLPEYAVAFHAIATLGGINTTANPLLAADELTGQLRDCGARLLVTVPDQLEKATAAAQAAGVQEIFVYGEADDATPFAPLLRAVGEPPEVAIDPADDLVALPYSSGTTGAAQGRDAHAPQPRRQHLPGAGGGDARGRPRRGGAAVLSHLRVAADDERAASLRRHGRDDAALRAGRVSVSSRTTASHAPSSCRRSCSRWPRTRSSTSSTCRALSS
jgi:AMP-binding enzyme